MLGVRDGTSTLVGAATMALSRLPDPPAEFLALQETIWAELGADARARYQSFGSAAQRFATEAPHCYLDMIGVRRSHHGHGFARVLLHAVHELSDPDEFSCGVRLTTERAANVGLYEHFGYRVQGHARVGEELETWTLFRAADRRRVIDALSAMSRSFVRR